uniref:Decapping nuclease n=1 Tax=Acrobeloides nanus TaxID=290746 RepID=A0A914D721_9BILA
MSNSSSANDYGEQRSDRLSCNPRKFHDDAKSPKFPSIEKPTVLGEFSLDRTRAIQSGRGNVRYIYDEYLKKDARFAFDLSQGFETFDQKNVHEKIDVLLKWIMKMSSPGDNLKKVLHECNFVCWRGLLTRVASMPFEKGCGEGNKIACCLFNGVVFMCEFDTELKITKLENETDFSKQMTYWGFKFEQYVTTDDPE